MFNYLSKLKVKTNYLFFWIFFFLNIKIFNLFIFNFWFVLLVWIFIFFYNQNFSFNNYLINLNYYSSIILNKFLLFYILNKLSFIFFQLKKNNLNLNFNSIFSYKWNPIIKQYSYYGYFKSNISHWNYSKTDEIKKYKF